MRTQNLLKLAASTLVFGAAFATGNGASAASDGSEKSVASVGENAEAKAKDALGKRKLETAVEWAERAVAAVPSNGQYRLLLGDAYFQSGRFQSAETSFADALSLMPGQDRVALKLALSKVALGKGREAIAILDEHKSIISMTDAGLARALAGDLGGAITTLETAARQPEATSKTRQNLAFSYAMAGRWIEARAVASQDLPTHTVDQRLSDWAAIARPRAAWDQLAALLKITPSYDDGQPKALALVKTDQAVAAAEVVPVAEAPVAIAAVEAPAAPVEVAAAPMVIEPAPAQEVAAADVPPPPPPAGTVEATPVAQVAVAAVSATAGGVVFVSQPVVQEVVAAPAKPKVIRSAKAPMKQKLAPVQVAVRTKAPIVEIVKKAPTAKPAAAPANVIVKKVSVVEGGKGYAVQLGAFSNAANANLAWTQASRAAGLGKYQRSQSKVSAAKGELHRIAVAGFSSREEAGRICAQVRAKGGSCFVRGTNGADTSTRLVNRKVGNGTKLAAVKRKAVKVASR